MVIPNVPAGLLFDYEESSIGALIGLFLTKMSDNPTSITKINGLNTSFPFFKCWFLVMDLVVDFP